MNYRIIDIDEAKPLQQGNPYAPEWPFKMLISGSSGSGKTNMIVNLLIGDKLEGMYFKRPGERYIKCNDVVLIGRHLNEPKWRIVRDFYEILAKDKNNGEDVSFNSFPPSEIPDVDDFDPDRSTIVVFEDLVTEPKKVQAKIKPYFSRGRHLNISPVYVTQRFFETPLMVRENITYLVLHRGAAPLRKIKNIISDHDEENVQKITKEIHKNFSKYHYIVFDLERSGDDPLAIRDRWDVPLLKPES